MFYSGKGVCLDQYVSLKHFDRRMLMLLDTYRTKPKFWETKHRICRNCLCMHEKETWLISSFPWRLRFDLTALVQTYRSDVKWGSGRWISEAFIVYASKQTEQSRVKKKKEKKTEKEVSWMLTLSRKLKLSDKKNEPVWCNTMQYNSSSLNTAVVQMFVFCWHLFVLTGAFWSCSLWLWCVTLASCWKAFQTFCLLHLHVWTSKNPRNTFQNNTNQWNKIMNLLPQRVSKKIEYKKSHKVVFITRLLHWSALQCTMVSIINRWLFPLNRVSYYCVCMHAQAHSFFIHTHYALICRKRCCHIGIHIHNYTA